MTGPRILLAASLVVTAVFAAITFSVLPREALVPVTITSTTPDDGYSVTRDKRSAAYSTAWRR